MTPQSRLARLHNLRDQIDQEIEREIRFQRRVKNLTGTARAIVGNHSDFTARIIAVSAGHFGCGPADLTGPTRVREATQARQVAAWLLREAGRSYPEIGRLLGRDHTTAMHACRRVESCDELVAHAAVVREALYGSEGAA